MITITEAAQTQIQKLLSKRPEPGAALHLSISGVGSDGFSYAFKTIVDSIANPADEVINLGVHNVYIDHASASKLDGATLDFYGLGHPTFHVENPNPVWEDDSARAVHNVIMSKINPGVAMHGGYVTMVDFKDNNVYIEFGGGCMGCGASQVTLKMGIERMIREAVPEVNEVVDVTDHSQGENPYYTSNQVGGSSPLNV